MKSISTEKMRALEEAALLSGISHLELMERAGAASAEFISRIAKKGVGVLVVCGTGNNGGDGLVCARHLSGAFQVSVLLLGEPRTPEASSNLRRLKNTKAQLVDRWPRKKPDIVVDAMLGTGARGKLREPFLSAAKKTNSSGATVISLDVPSGIDPDTGESSGIAVKPTHTLAFHALKGCAANADCGEVSVIDIGL